MELKKRAIWFVVPTLLVLGLVVIFPVVYSLTVSFLGYDLRIPRHPFIGLDNYRWALTNPGFHNSLKVTGLLLVGELSLELPIGLGLALLLIRIPKGRKIFQPVLLIATMVMPIVIGYMGRLIFETRSGPINYMLNLVGIESLIWHANPHTSLLTVLILRVWRWVPFVMVVFVAGLLSLPKDPYDSAQVDGASAIQTFRYITLPLLRPVITLMLIIRTLETVTSMDIVYILTMGGPGRSTEIVSLFTYLIGFKYWDVGRSSALSWLIMIPVFALMVIFVKFMERGERA